MLSLLSSQSSSSSTSVQCNVFLVVCLLFIFDQHVCFEKSTSQHHRSPSLSNNNHNQQTIPLMKRSPFPERRLDCDLFCRRTGFAGSVGGCQCGYTLFNVRKRPETPEDETTEELSDYTDEPWLNWIKLRRFKSGLDRYGFTGQQQQQQSSSSLPSSGAMKNQYVSPLKVTSQTDSRD